MPPKKNAIPDFKSTYGDSTDSYQSPRRVSLSLLLEGAMFSPGDYNFFAFYNGQIVLDARWQDGLILESEALPLNLKDPYYQDIIADKPLILLVRAIGGKGAKDPDPLLNVDNRAGATVDLFPILIGEEKINVRTPLVLMNTGEFSGCTVEVTALCVSEITSIAKMPLNLTLISAHCLPVMKEGTVYICAIGLDGIQENNMIIEFGMSLSNVNAKKIVWATASTGGHLANTAFNVPNEDKYVPQDFEARDTSSCNSVYWNAMKRILVDPILLQQRLSFQFLIEVAGVPKTGKIDVCGRYMGFIDAGVLLEPGQYGVTTCTKLKFYNEVELPEQIGPLLELPSSSAKVSARDTDVIMDEHGHNAYIVIRFDLTEALVPKVKLTTLYEAIGFPPPETSAIPTDELHVDPPPEDNKVDVKRIRKESGALAVHKELSSLACRGAIPMNQSIKRTAANRLLMRVRTMLKQFPPGECSEIEWQDIVSSQHAASRRAVTYSFAPQPPPKHPPSRFAAARCRMAEDNRIADQHIEDNLIVVAGHPRPILSKALRYLEQRNDSDARNLILRAISTQTRNRYLLWIFAGQEFDKGPEAVVKALAALRIATKGDYSDATTNAIAWAALHTLNHVNNNYYAGFVSAYKMRKSYELIREWKPFLERWVESSGEEEIFWVPYVVASENPMVIAAAFFLCLRCYAFSEAILKCVEQGCATRGSRLRLNYKISPDVYYLKAASFILRRQLDKAMEIIEDGIIRFGPSAIMSQIRLTCLKCLRGWDGDCENALRETERAGAELCPILLIQAALGSMRNNPKVSLQRAARAHMIAPSAHTALVIGRVYARMEEYELAERWAAAAVKEELLLADGWAFLAIVAMYNRDINKARAMLRTAKQVGPLSPDIEEEVDKLTDAMKIEFLPDSLTKNLCFCDYY